MAPVPIKGLTQLVEQMEKPEPWFNLENLKWSFVDPTYRLLC